MPQPAVLLQGNNGIVLMNGILNMQIMQIDGKQTLQAFFMLAPFYMIKI